jgi:hypothetical protein
MYARAEGGRGGVGGGEGDGEGRRGDELGASHRQRADFTRERRYSHRHGQRRKALRHRRS